LAASPPYFHRTRLAKALIEAEDIIKLLGALKGAKQGSEDGSILKALRSALGTKSCLSALPKPQTHRM
jgi:predicted RecB family endonuclease